MEEINQLLQKYNNFKDAQIRSVQNISESAKVVTMVLLDDDGQDLNSVKLEFNGITESRILQNSVLAFLDMGSGISLLNENGLYGFAIGSDTAMLHVHNAPMYIVASELKIED